MITVAYSTRYQNNEFKKHIEDTIGLKGYEIIEKVNNGEKSLTQVYNEVLTETKNDIVVFCHDDILFNNKYWGKRVIENFRKRPEYGILGVAGTQYMPKNGKWWEIKSEMIGRVNHTSNGKTWESAYSHDAKNGIRDAVVVDGLFIAISRRMCNVPNFNEKYDGFHFYDVSFCYENFLKGTKIGVMNNVNLTHGSVGKTNDEWERKRVLFMEEHEVSSKRNTFQVFPVLSPKKKEPLVSIIMPIFNYGNMFNKTLESVFSSNYGNIELIIVNDGSTNDYVKDKLESLKGHPQIVIIEQENKGPASARNNGISHARGKYILPLDSDDLIHPDMISKMVLTIKADPSLSPVYCDVMHFGEENGLEVKPEWSFERLKNGPFITSTALFSLSAFNITEGYDEQLDAWEDYDLWLQMATKGFIGKRINRALFYYYRHDKEGSRSTITTMEGKQKELMEKIHNKRIS